MTEKRRKKYTLLLSCWVPTKVNEGALVSADRLSFCRNMWGHRWTHRCTHNAHTQMTERENITDHNGNHMAGGGQRRWNVSLAATDREHFKEHIRGGKMRREEGHTVFDCTVISHITEVSSNPHCLLLSQHRLSTVAQQSPFITAAVWRESNHVLDASTHTELRERLLTHLHEEWAHSKLLQSL